MPCPHCPHPHIEERAEGRLWVQGTRVPVDRLWHWHRTGIPYGILRRRYPQIAPAALLSALSTAYDHEQEMRAWCDEKKPPGSP